MANLNPEQKWDVYRDDEGNPVTITQAQGRAIWHAIETVNAVRKAEGVKSLWEHPSPDIEMGKSRLLGRMLYQGRAPLNEKPPHHWGACGYHLTDPDLCPSCGQERTGPGGELGRSIAAKDDVTRWAKGLGERVEGKVVTVTYCAQEWHSGPKGVWG